MFAQDRDLLALEPTLFRDVGWAGQRLVKGIASTSFITLSFESQDVGLDAAAVEAGHVVVLGGSAYEVVERYSDSDIGISRLRARITDEPIPPTPAESADAVISSFRPQIEIVHRQLLRQAGIQPESVMGSGPGAGETGESAITNGQDLIHVEALGALHLIYAAASAGLGASAIAAAQSAHYREAFTRERERAVVRLDLDGDGEADASRSLGAIQLLRA